MAWTRKSSEPHFAAMAVNSASIEAMSSTSQGSTMVEPTDCASGLTRFPSASP